MLRKCFKMIYNLPYVFSSVRNNWIYSLYKVPFIYRIVQWQASEYIVCIRSLLYVEYIWHVFLLIVVEEGIWKKIIDLYPQLVSCIHSKSEQVLVELQLALIAYSDLLNIPAISIANGTWHVRAGLLSVQRSYRHTRWLCLLLPSIHYNLRVLLTVSSMLNSTFLSPCLTYSGIAEQQITTNWPT